VVARARSALRNTMTLSHKRRRFDARSKSTIGRSLGPTRPADTSRASTDRRVPPSPQRFRNRLLQAD
jgi:hypothetical protein